jgi:cytochrome bd-type quinol oxidase subunit 1
VDDHVLIDRLKFTLTVTFHYLFPSDDGAGAVHRLMKSVSYLGRRPDHRLHLLGRSHEERERHRTSPTTSPPAFAAMEGMFETQEGAPLIVIGWLITEERNQIAHPLWRQACDAVFALSSAGVAFLLAAALGNVVRGVPLGADGYFHLALFEILNGYALLVGVFGLVALSAHGAGFLAFSRRRRARPAGAARGTGFVVSGSSPSSGR